MTRAVLFDLDETLLDREASLRLYLRDQQGRMNWGHPDYLRRYLELDNRGYTPRPRLYEQLALEFDLPWSPARLVQDFAERAWLECVLFPEVTGVIGRLRAEGYKLGVVTNGRTVIQRRKLDGTGLSPLFDAILISEAEGVAKPDAEIFRRACGRLGVGAREAVFVGDHPVNDIQGAQGAGLRAIWRSGVWPEQAGLRPDAAVADLRELFLNL